MTSETTAQAAQRRRRGAVAPPGALAAAALVLVVPLSGCTDDPAEDARPTTSAPATTASAPDVAATADASGEGTSTPSGTGTAAGADTGATAPGAATGGPAPASAPPATAPPEATSTAARTSPPPEQVVQLVDVTVEESGDADTVRFGTTGGVPGYSVRYVDAVRVEGEPVLLTGEAFLEVVLESADPDGDEGLSADVAVAVVPDLDVVKEIQFARYVDGVVTYAVGLGSTAEFTVEVDDTGLTLTFPR